MDRNNVMVMVLGVRLAALLLVLSSPAFGAGRTTPTPEPDRVVSPPGPLTSLPTADSDPATPPADPVSPPDEQAADRVREAVPVEPDPALVAGDPAVDALLDALEQSGRDLTGFTADVVLHKWDGVTERREIRAGRFIYDANPETKRRRFAVLFDRTIVNNRQEDDRQHYIFADGWLVEVYEARKQFIKRQIVPPGQVFDPLRLGEGPFPLPIGQAKADVLRRFEVSAIPVPSEGLFASLKDVDGLRLVPRAGTSEAQDFASVDLYYDRATRLPIGIETAAAKILDPSDESTRDRTRVRLNNVVRNPVLDAEALAKLDVREPDPREWQVDVRPWSGGGR